MAKRHDDCPLSVLVLRCVALHGHCGKAFEPLCDSGKIVRQQYILSIISGLLVYMPGLENTRRQDVKLHIALFQINKKDMDSSKRFELVD